MGIEMPANFGPDQPPSGNPGEVLPEKTQG
jgi:hypothetical protein